MTTTATAPDTSSPQLGEALRGRGSSFRPDADRCTTAPQRCLAIDTMAADVTRFLTDLDLGPVVLAGHSMGSLVAQRVAPDRPGLVRDLVLVGTTADARRTPILGSWLVEAVLSASAPDSVRISYTREPAPLGTAGALSLVADRRPTDTFVVVNGDTLTTLDFDAVAEQFERSDADALVVCARRTVVLDFGIPEIDPDGRQTARVPIGTWLGFQIARTLLERPEQALLGPFNGQWVGVIVGAGLGYSLGGVVVRRLLWAFDRGERALEGLDKSG